MTPGTPTYLNGVKSTFCGYTPRGLAKVLSAKQMRVVRPERLRRKERSDLGGKHRRTA